MEERNEWRTKIASSVDKFIDLGDKSEANESVELILSEGVDILLDLNGHSKGARLDVLHREPSPVRALFLGYAGSLGKEGVLHYLTGDVVCSTPAYAKNVVERLSLLPHSYHCNGHKENYRHLKLGSGALMMNPSKQLAKRHGIPQDGFLLSCFNQLSKLTPSFYRVWTALLRSHLS